MIQGYKFEIYYPNLIDMATAPSYVLEKDGDSRDTYIIRFHSGPPYKDVAFRIVNDEWEIIIAKGVLPVTKFSNLYPNLKPLYKEL
ncbi:hypothetical protein RJ639_018961 [Escallonia herrerae]|uniref:Splicing factor Cactin C-terminal domain-containing protein n=1 Tax=Escallonia herrerae TaxID=1293975 RepID=A0AA88V8E2_9ASTE|nr:hypothetical protein RJ639_018961 [Escallonia herrerae]